MTRLLYRLGRGAALHPWRTLGLWALAATLVFGLAALVAFGAHVVTTLTSASRPSSSIGAGMRTARMVASNAALLVSLILALHLLGNL